VNPARAIGLPSPGSASLPAMKVLIVGATGQLGLAIGRRLLAAGHSVTGLVRPGSAGEARFTAAGGVVRSGDLRDAASVDAACQGVDAIVSTATAVTSGGAGNSLAAVDGAGHAGLIEAARRHGVGRFVYVSASPKYDDRCPLIQQKRATERLLRSSGLDHVILQPSFFMDVWFSPALGWDLAAGRAQIFGAGTAPISFIAMEDVASAAVAALTATTAPPREIPLGGPEAISPRRAVEIIEAATGRKFKVTTVPGFVPRLAAVVLRPFNPKLASLMALGAETLTGDPIDLTRARALAGLRLTPLAEWVKKRR
jgi:uncharacterized protein YbjT (DUF2867 family)